MKDRETSERPELEILPQAIRRARGRNMAIDAGANIGCWSLELAKHFAAVLAIEPVESTYGILRERTDRVHNIYPTKVALLDRSYFAVPDDGATQTIALDQIPLEDCDLLKVDLEGAELRALEGARQTLERWRPVIVVEVIERQLRRYGDTPDALHRFLTGLGYELVDERKPNRIYTHPENRNA